MMILTWQLIHMIIFSTRSQTATVSTCGHCGDPMTKCFQKQTLHKAIRVQLHGDLFVIEYENYHG